MISSSEAYVFITLPKTFTPVPAGRVSFLGSSPEEIEFFYGRRYLERAGAVPLDPIHLPLQQNSFYDSSLPMFGALRDAAPDSWGRFIIEKRAGQIGLNEIDYLLASSGERVGALDFGKSPNNPLERSERPLIREGDRSWLQLGELATAIEALDNEQATLNEQVLELLDFGTSMGGARPKTVIERECGHERSLWLAKFNRKDDRINHVRVEYSTNRLARLCGLGVPDMKIHSMDGRDILLSKRFERMWDKKAEQYAKTHFLSALTLTGRHEMENARSSYQEVAQIIRQVGRDPQYMNRELFRRMVFNIMTGNVDDHLRNHGFLLTQKGYVLSPAYDLMPIPQVSYTRDLAIGVGKQGRVATVDNALSDTGPFGLTRKEAETIALSVKETTRQWRGVFREREVGEQDCNLLADCFRETLA
ncbi:MAG: Serine/threonine-protein kinase toxin HipA [Gammaproteobacteria bacterium]|nr:Serine/threonine-protein kinase toxin HipA [Gammaproteobacteria bacterium]